MGRTIHISRSLGLFVMTLILLAMAMTGTALTDELPEAELRSWPSDFRMVVEPGKENEEAVVFHVDTSGGSHRDKHHDKLNSSPLFSTGFSLSAGYRRDHLKWSIAGPDNSPNVLSELEWEDIFVHI